MSANTHVQSGVIFGARAAFFLAAQRLLHTFNPTLRDIASDTDTTNGASGLHGQSHPPSQPHSPGGSSGGYIDHTGASRSGGDDTPDTPYSDGGYDDSEPVTRAGTPDIEMTAPILRLNHSQLVSGAAIRDAKERRRGTRRMGRVARILFSACFAEACTLLGLVIAHELGALDAVWQFSISLHILLALVLLVLPFAQCLLFTYGGSASARRKSISSLSTSTTSRSSLSLPVRLLVAIVPYTLYIFLFTRLPPYITVHIDADGDGVEDWASWAGWVAPAMGRLVFMGVICLGGLSGFGAVRTAWMFYERTRISDTLTSETIMQAERSLWRVRQDIANKEAEPSTERRSSWRNVFIGSASSELAGLKAMERQAAQALAGMKQRMSRQVFAQTFGGKVFNVVGKVFGVYCAARVLMCLPSLFLSTSAAAPEAGTKGNSNGDWISFMLAFLLSHLPIPLIDVEAVDIPVWSRAISLGFTGLIILTSLAQVLRSLRRALKLTSKSVGAGFLLLTLGQLFATYIISLLTQLRATIPEDDDLLATLPDFRIFGRLFDVVFLGAAFATLLYRFISSKVEL